MTEREKVIKGLECIRDWSQFAVNKGWLVAGASEKMVKYAKDALELLKAQDVTPEELERLKKCRHDCKIECLLKEYDRVKNERDALLKAQEPVKPYTKRDGRTTFFLCGGCNKPLCIAKDSYKPKHCPECGREVKWE